MKLWYNKPATKWCEALPVGNGRLGGMVFGDPNNEVIQLNEDSIWNGKPLDRHNPNAREQLPVIRRLLREGRIPEAERLALYSLSGTPVSQRAYQTAGELYLNNIGGAVQYGEYERALDLDAGIVTVRYRTEKGSISREVFSSYPDGVLVMHIKAGGEERLNFSCNLGRKNSWKDESTAKDGNCIRFVVDGGAGISFCVTALAWQQGGSVHTMGDFLLVEDAEEAVIYLAIETSFRHADYQAAADLRLTEAALKGFGRIFKDHTTDYQRLFGRVSLEFSEGEKSVPSMDNASALPTDERLKAVQQGSDDAGLLALHFQYGRYLLISSSRENSLPANLQGIWNDSLTPPWESKYTININTEMNYWLAESANLSECHLPYFDFLWRVKENGKKTAKVMYGCRGSVAHHNVDIYADTAPQDHYLPATFWVMGEAWLSTHIWEHYLYTQDKDFLETYFDILEQSVLFFYDFLIEGPDGTLLTSPSVSPENTYIMKDGTRGTMCEGATMDNQILTELLSGYLGACHVLGKDDRVQKANEVLSRLPKMKIGKYGQLMEWTEDYEEEEPGHRHISHLYAVYPGTKLSTKDTPKILEAAKVSLERRLSNGGGHTGWSRAWIIGLWARFHEAEKAYANYKALLSGGTFPNMMDNHPVGDGYVFQIDGNLGAAASLVEQLVQSHEGYVHLLPALPDIMKTGRVRGLCVRGGAVIDMEWENKKVTNLRVKSRTDRQMIFLINGRKVAVLLKKNQETVVEVTT